MRGAFIHVVWVSLLIAMGWAAPEPQQDTPITSCSSETLESCVAVMGTCMDQAEPCDGTEVINELFCASTESCKCCCPDTTPPVVTAPPPPPPPVCSEPLESCAVLKGRCVPKGEVCDGKEITNALFCEFTDTCKCCKPKHVCSEPLPSCVAVSGTCIAQDEICDGKEVTNNALFCELTDNCKCCIPHHPTTVCLPDPNVKVSIDVDVDVATPDPDYKCRVMGGKCCPQSFGPHINECGRCSGGRACCCSRCIQIKDSGYGDKSDERWYYDSSNGVGKCLSFTYKGEGGNDNRFDDLATCHKECTLLIHKG